MEGDRDNERDNDRTALIRALARVGKMSEEERLRRALTDVHDPRAIGDLEDLVKGSFARLELGRSKLSSDLQDAMTNVMPDRREITQEQMDAAISLLKSRDAEWKNTDLCADLSWEDVEARFKK